MTTYYLNDPSSNWNLTTNVIQSLSNNNLQIQSSGSGILYLKKIDSLNSLKYTEINIDNSSYRLKSNLDLSSCYITCFNDIIKFDTQTFTPFSITNTSCDLFFLPINSNIPANNTELINKLYVDAPIQQANYIRGNSSLFTNCPKYYASGSPTFYTNFGYQQMGFLYPTRDITITGLVSYSSNGSSLSNGSINEMWLVSFPSLTSSTATIIGKCSNTNFWKAAYTTYASNFTESPFSITLKKDNKYGIVIFSNSTVAFQLRGINNNYGTYMYDSSYDLMAGGAYAGSSSLSIGNTFSVANSFAFQIPYVGVF